ncbi:zinc finger and SCAN domain-containing protein 29-like [Alligator sinensis]|uniref:Zinc finger and SCAN domain-containing protein 29-like n=1 Tax=Alligator sinensis TaxID=38654 RepID=A0A1U7SUF4_ALLSI|nr:zinc finger and SCAN domain-containing protein 29-like [Alligator sinensis]
MASELGSTPALGFPFQALVQPLVKKEEQDPAGPMVTDKVPCFIPARNSEESLTPVPPLQVKQEPQEEPVQRWEVLQAPLFPAEAAPALLTPQQLEVAPRDDAPTLETRRRCFRGFRSQEAMSPREFCGHLRELCQRWLEPQRRSKEQILELVVLEQFLAVLPQEMQSWVWGRGVETCAEAVALVEGFQLGQAEKEKLQVTVHVKLEEVASDNMMPAGALWEPLDSWLQRSEPQPVPEAGWGESLGPQSELPPVPKEEPPPREESVRGGGTLRTSNKDPLSEAGGGLEISSSVACGEAPSMQQQDTWQPGAYSKIYGAGSGGEALGIVLADHVQKRERSGVRGKMLKGMRRSYDRNFKMMVINYAEKTNNCEAGRIYSVTEANVRRWRQLKGKLKTAKSTRRSFSGPKKGRFPEIEKQVLNYVQRQRSEGVRVTCEMLRLQALEIAKELNIPQHDFKASNGWCIRMMRRSGLALRQRTPLAQQLPSGCSEKL